MKRAKYVKIQSLKNQSWIADQCEVAGSFLARLKGLMGRKSFNTGQGLWITPCNDIHMWFMRISIDVVFLRNVQDSIYEVTSIRENLRPWKLLPTHDWSARETLELPQGTIARCDIRPGDRLCIS